MPSTKELTQKHCVPCEGGVAKLTPDHALELNRRFQDYLKAFGELQQIVKPMLEELAVTERK